MSLSSRQKRWYWLLAIPYIATFWVSSYNRVEPALFGMPFYYWYQLAWVVFSSVLVGIVFHHAHLKKTPAEKSPPRTDASAE
jgi:uncharacterized membrane protein YhdT